MQRVTGILLAAGSGSRFGGHKLLAPLADGTPMAMAAARGLRGALDEVLAVVRPGEDQLAALLAGEGLGIVECECAGQGMGHSLAAGIRAAARAPGWLVALADMPDVAVSTIVCVTEALTAGAELAAPYYRGQRGHPVGFGSVFGDQLAALSGDAGARELLARHGGRLVRVEVEDPGVLTDIDTPDELLEHIRRNLPSTPDCLVKAGASSPVAPQSAYQYPPIPKKAPIPDGL